MTPKRYSSMIGSLGMALLAGLAFSPQAKAGDQPTTLKIGLIRTMFQELPPALVNAAARPFRSVMEAQTGYDGTIEMLDDADTLARQMAAGDVQIGVFPGFEYAWMKRKHPQLEAVVVAVKKAGPMHAVLVSKRGSSVSGFEDLDGKTVSVPKAAREHVRLFLDRGCESCGKTPTTLASRISEPRSSEAAINEVALGRADAAVTDTAALASYKRLYPSQSGRIHEAVRSECFPPTVIVVHRDVLDGEAVRRLRSGLSEAHRSKVGQDLMFLWQLRSFEVPSDDFNADVQRIIAAYPPKQ